MTTHVTCREGVDLLMDYEEGMLPPARREALDAHVAICPRCTAFVRSYLSAPRILRAATDVSFPDDSADALRRFLAERL